MNIENKDNIFIQTSSQEKIEYINIKKRRTKKFEEVLTPVQQARIDRIFHLENLKREDEISPQEANELQELERVQTKEEIDYLRALEDEIESYFS